MTEEWDVISRINRSKISKATGGRALNTKATAILRDYFGYDSFRTGQENVIEQCAYRKRYTLCHANGGRKVRLLSSAGTGHGGHCSCYFTTYFADERPS